MPDLLLVALGALLLTALQGIGLLLVRTLGEDVREAWDWWIALTGWPVWLPVYLFQDWKERWERRHDAHARRGR